jgi:hypothetical protein
MTRMASNIAVSLVPPAVGLANVDAATQQKKRKKNIRQRMLTQNTESGFMVEEQGAYV